MNDNVKNFRNLIKECLSEVHQETSKRSQLKESLRKVVKDVLTEIANVTTPEPDKSEIEKVQKGFAKDGNERESDTNDKRVEEIESIVHGFDPTWKAYMDDHGQIIVRAHNMLYVRIVQKFENNYDVDAMVKLVDRIRAIALTWDQVKAFVKANFKDLKSKSTNKTMADKHTERSVDNEKQKSANDGKAAGPTQKDITNRGEKNNGEDAKIKDTSNKHKDFNEPQTKKPEDMPDQPMKKVTEPGKDPEGKNHDIEKTDKAKPPKHDKSPTDLKPGDKKTTKFRPRK
jgi:hypothetical protein